MVVFKTKIKNYISGISKFSNSAQIFGSFLQPGHWSGLFSFSYNSSIYGINYFMNLNLRNSVTKLKVFVVENFCKIWLRSKLIFFSKFRNSSNSSLYFKVAHCWRTVNVLRARWKNVFIHIYFLWKMSTFTVSRPAFVHLFIGNRRESNGDRKKDELSGIRGNREAQEGEAASRERKIWPK